MSLSQVVSTGVGYTANDKNTQAQERKYSRVSVEQGPIHYRISCSMSIAELGRSDFEPMNMGENCGVSVESIVEKCVLTQMCFSD